MKRYSILLIILSLLIINFTSRLTATSLIVRQVDTTKPKLTITSHADGQIVTTGIITLSGTATDLDRGNSGIVSVTINGKAANGGTANGSETANWSLQVDLIPGENVFTVVAKDGSTDQNEATLLVVIIFQGQSNDISKPKIEITSHTEGQLVTTGSITLSGTATDLDRGNSGIVSVTINGKAANGGTANGSETANWSLQVDLTPGDNLLTVAAKDGSSNQNEATKSITINFQSQQNPTITLSPKSQPVQVGNTTQLTVALSAVQQSNTTITLGSTNGSIVSVPSSVIINAGAMTATFNATGVALGGPVNLTATLPQTLGGASDTASVTVTNQPLQNTSTLVTSTINPSIYGQLISLTASISKQGGTSTPTGTVTFKDGAVTLGTGMLNASGQAIFTTAALLAVPHTITAEYGGDSNFNYSISPPITQTVNKAALTVTADNQSKLAGDPLPQLTYKITGFVNGEPAAVLSGLPSLSTTATANSPAGNYPIDIAIGSLSAANYSFNFVNGTLTVSAATTITTHPISQTICTGSPVTFSVAATGGNSQTYQWRKNGVAIGNATSANYTINSVAAGDAGTYDVFVSGVTSNPATLTVNATTAITTHPSGQIKLSGQDVTFSVVAQGANLTYQWRKNGTAINSATGNSYTIPAAALSDAGNYDVVITGACGAVTSNPATLIINNPAPEITLLNPGNVPAGGAAFTLSITGTRFVSGAVVRWNGQDRETKFVSSVLVTALIPATDIASEGTSQITVANPSPGGGGSNTLSFSIFAGYEADLSPRPHGKRNGTVSISDWVQAGRFVIGLDAATAGGEFQRADTAPKALLGDGKITLGDWVQAGRYLIGLDAVVAAGGPTGPVFGNLLGDALSTDFSRVEAGTSPEGDTLNAERTVRVVNTNFTRGQVGTVQIALDAQGNENAISFSLQFDPKAMSFVEALAGDGANGAAVIVNSSQAISGRLGLAMMLPAGQQLAAGTRNLINLRFTPNGGISDVSTGISFSDQLLTREIVDAFATSIPQVSYVGSIVNISGKAVATVSAANYVGGELAADSIVSAFGLQLSSFTQAAVSLPLPISLGGSQVVVKDSKNTERFAPLFYASPGQINFQIPAETAEGVATLTVFSGAGASQTGLVIIGKVAPALFSADATGVGLAAGSALTVHADGSREENNLARYDAATSKFIAQPIDMGNSSDQVYLTLYGTGIKNRSNLANVKIRIGGIDAPVLYAAAQGFFAGLDQINVAVPRGLAGRGIVNVEITVEGKVNNSTSVVVK